jgi:predicted nucleotide-binding protein
MDTNRAALVAQERQRLIRCRGLLTSLDSVSKNDKAITAICLEIANALTRTFGAGSHEFAIFKPVYAAAQQRTFVEEIFYGPSQRTHDDKSLAITVERLSAVINLLGNAPQSSPPGTEIRRAKFTRENSGPDITRRAVPNRRVFVIHGHDEGSREAVAAFLHKIGLEPIILSEHAHEGLTIKEKFEVHADVGYAVALLTPDDECVADGAHVRRARQNVILELGYFAGRMGLKRVSVIRRGNVEMPSDLNGLGSIPYDSDWKQRLARELEKAEYEVDWKKAMA